MNNGCTIISVISVSLQRLKNLCQARCEVSASPAKMQHDDLIWGSVGNGFCSYKVKTVKQNFCRNKYNLTGLCSRAGCPLANSRYATIMESGDALYLFIKTVERAHSPRNLWQKIKLSTNYRAALAQIDKHLEFWPAYYIHKAKQRLTKMVQYHIRRRRIALRTKTRLVGVKKKIERRERTREVKAAAAAKLDKAIERELLERLRSGAYGDIYNFPQEQYEKVLEDEAELEENTEEDEDLDMDADEYAADFEYEDEDNSDIEEIESSDLTGRPQYDFDDDDDDDGEDDHDDHMGESASGGDDILLGSEARDPLVYVRERAKRRGLNGSQKVKKGKKGRLLRRSRLSEDNVEVEYEHERDFDASRAS